MTSCFDIGTIASHNLHAVVRLAGPECVLFVTVSELLVRERTCPACALIDKRVAVGQWTLYYTLVD